MSKAFGIGFAAMVVILAIVIWTGFEKTSGNHLAPVGSIGKVRIVPVTDDVTLMVIDFNIKNDSDRDMIVRTIQADVDKSDGTSLTGSTVAAGDTVDAFHSYPVLGEQYNPPIKERDTIPAHQAVDRMVGIRFDAPSAQVESRRHVNLHLADVTGPVADMTK